MQKRYDERPSRRHHGAPLHLGHPAALTGADSEAPPYEPYDRNISPAKSCGSDLDSKQVL
jgi:hypothetical protein